MFYDTEFKMNVQQKELLNDKDEAFPYICNYAICDVNEDKSIPWHWHPSFEIDCVYQGEIIVQTTDTTKRIKQGEAIFINSNVMHNIKYVADNSVCKIYAHIFDAHFLSGMYNNVIDQKYIYPILKSYTLQTFSIAPKTYSQLQMIESLFKLVELNKQHSFGYEFAIRAELCNFWCMLLRETSELRDKTAELSSIDDERIRIMVQFIHEHYGEKISLQDIASSANISSRECNRCFQRGMGVSPVNYLTTYRVRMSAQMLLQTGNSISTISEDCGFSSSSYFGKVFQEVMNCTPKQYRKQ